LRLVQTPLRHQPRGAAGIQRHQEKHPAFAAHTTQSQDHVGVHHNFCFYIDKQLLQALLYAKDNCIVCRQAGLLQAARRHTDDKASYTASVHVWFVVWMKSIAHLTPIVHTYAASLKHDIEKCSPRRKSCLYM